MKRFVVSAAVVLLATAALIYILVGSERSTDKPVTMSPEDVEGPLLSGSALREAAHESSEVFGTDETERDETWVSPAGAEEPTDGEAAQDATSEKAVEDVQRFEELAGAQRFAVPDPDEELEARITMSRQVFGNAGPRACDNVCDCNPGEGCDTSAGICLPGLPAGRCCTWEQCPSGAPCTTSEGRSSTCD